MVSRHNFCAVDRVNRPWAGVLVGLCLLTGLALPGCGDPSAAINVGTALSRARQTNQIVLVEFWGLDQACSRMDSDVYPHPTVRRDLEDFIRVRRTYAFCRGAARNLGITGAPGFAALRPDGSLIAAKMGYMDREAFRQFLVRAKIFFR
jgi:hypothetical protein